MSSIPKHRLVFEVEDFDEDQGGAKITMWTMVKDGDEWMDIHLADCTSAGLLALYSRICDRLNGRDNTKVVNEARKWLYVAVLGIFPAVVSTFFDGSIEGRSYDDIFGTIVAREPEFIELVTNMSEKTGDKPIAVNTALKYLLTADDPVNTWVNILKRAVCTESGRSLLADAGINMPDPDDDEDEELPAGTNTDNEQTISTSDGAKVRVVGWDFSSLKKE